MIISNLPYIFETYYEYVTYKMMFFRMCTLYSANYNKFIYVI